MNEVQKIYYDRYKMLVTQCLPIADNDIERQKIMFNMSELKNIIRKNCEHQWVGEEHKRHCRICHQEFSYY